MSDQNTAKLNLLLAELGDTRLVSSRWLRAHGYSNSLVARYVSSGWLVSPARGVYIRKGALAVGGRGSQPAGRGGAAAARRWPLRTQPAGARALPAPWRCRHDHPVWGGAATGLAR